MVFVPEEYINRKNGFDYAFIKLSQKVKRNKYITIGVNWNREELETMVCGYPDEDNYKLANPQGTKFKTFQFSRAGNNKTRVNFSGGKRSQLYHEHPTLQGQSGSPLIVNIG